MLSNSRHLGVLLGFLMVGAIAAAGCGSEPSEQQKEGDVHAINLENGEAREFDAENLVPAGWAVCELSDCSGVIARVRCNMLGPGACLLNGQCRLRLRCDIDIPSWMVPADDVRHTNSSEGQDPLPSGCGAVAPASYPVGCELVCTRKSTISCEEIQNPNQCAAQPQCDWEQICYDQPAGPGGSAAGGEGTSSGSGDAARPACDPEATDCGGLMPPMPPPPPPCTGVCRPRAPQPCEQLDRYACDRREDCAWRPEPLPLYDDSACAMGTDCGMPYNPFCRPRVEPVCPPRALAELVCPAGQQKQEEYDAQGCLVGQTCVPVACAPLANLAPAYCPDGQVPLRELDERGCVIRVSCEPVDCPTVEPRKPECTDGVQPQPIVKDGCLVGYECTAVCPPVPPKPDCAGNLKSVYRGTCQAGWSCAEPLDPGPCDELVTAYQEALLRAKSCGVSSDGTRPDQDFAPEWIGLCSMTVPSALGCSSCPTYVNPANQEAIAQLNKIRSTFEQGQCFRGRACPAVMCLAPAGAACARDADTNSAGVCTDQRPGTTY